MHDYKNEIQRRRTFAIISHPDAGKTTLTEKFLLYGGAIQSAGTVKGKASDKHAVSDWMDLEKKRGISITSSVLQFEYNGYCVNILDTPGHQDFSEDTYRTLMAADSAVMVIDAAKGIEPQTRKLFKVCSFRGIPIFTFINKLDREARDPLDLMNEIEEELGIGTYPVNLPISSGQNFRGVYDRQKRHILAFNEFHAGRRRIEGVDCDLNDTETVDNLIGASLRTELTDMVELLDAAGFELDIDKINSGKLTPVFFGSALNNFGVEPFLQYFLKMTTPPLSHKTTEGEIIDPFEEHFSAFVFKIQANMNKAHRDRIAFMRICSGRFERNKEYFHVQEGKLIRPSQPQQLMAQEREVIDEAYAGDIIGVFDPGIFSISDTLCDDKRKVRYKGIMTFAPEHFAEIEQIDSMKRKQFQKGMSQIAQEGAIQIFFKPNQGIERVIVGVVGMLQYEVLEYRMESEYGVKFRRRDLNYQVIKKVVSSPVELDKLDLTNSEWVQDVRGRNLIVFAGQWCVDWAISHNKGLELDDFEDLETLD